MYIWVNTQSSCSWQLYSIKTDVHRQRFLFQCTCKWSTYFRCAPWRTLLLTDNVTTCSLRRTAGLVTSLELSATTFSLITVPRLSQISLSLSHPLLSSSLSVCSTNTNARDHKPQLEYVAIFILNFPFIFHKMPLFRGKILDKGNSHENPAIYLRNVNITLENFPSISISWA